MSKFKALIFDLDGTAIPNDPRGMPSRAVIKAVAKAKKVVSVSIATGRSSLGASPVMKTLAIKEPSIIYGGTQVVNPKTSEVLWEKDMNNESVRKVIKILSKYNYKTYISNKNGTHGLKNIKILGSERIFYVMNVTRDDANEILKKLANLEEIIAHAVTSYMKGNLDIHITHKEASKRNAMKQLLKILDAQPAEIIVVGDSNNDLPLFESAGFKVAMGNATKELKAKADYIAPNVKKDGLVDVINKYILQNTSNS